MTTRSATTHESILQNDHDQAVAAATDALIARALTLAPLSYAALRSIPAGGIGRALAGLDAATLRLQAIRLLVERGAATGRFWGWGDVDTLEAWLTEQQQKETTTVETQITPDPTQVEAALLTIEEAAERRVRYARDGGDVDAEKLARREAQAARDAAALVADGAYKVTFNGDLLVKSPRGMWHRVGRRPAQGDAYSPICCSCEWATKTTAVGPCKHVVLWEGHYQAVDAVIAALDDSAGPLPFDPDHDPAYTDSLLTLDPGQLAA